MGGPVPSHLLFNVILIERASDEISQRSLTLFTNQARRAIGLRGDVSVRITSSAELQELNRRFRRKDRPTDVLSFPAGSPEAAGDIAISYQIAATNAKALGHTVMTELKILILHGLLHLAGYDHESDNGEMSRRESELRRQFGLPLSLIERSQSSSLRGSLTGVNRPPKRARKTAGLRGKGGGSPR